MARYVYVFLMLFCMFSCSVEQVSKSPLNKAFAEMEVSQVSSSMKAIPEELETNAEIAKLTNSIASIPYVKDGGINKEIDQLKINVQNFVYAYQAYNVEGQKRNIKRIQNNYKKLYTSRKKMSEDEFLALNHYLVKIKSGLSQLYNVPME